ncbi:alkaline phosphatase family protein [Pontibacter silvestris]|uniref:Alkaline phosphatase family protein n=1 Tax=Pontibacter silvestris TaxID=2305183 RepID=A0ABW4X0H3_9BACT|nr:nucleotide pyrophosphatase/phosphodiesterase family protein [Pontibacter silvestris]MCC9136072.1 alkaline phosphatase family protein [Pontibacter silvestris]
MQKTVVLDVVGLTQSLIGKNTPFLAKWTQEAQGTTIQPVVPAVTCTAHATYLTGKWPKEHGIIANGWYFRDEDEVKLWRQSNKLIQSPKIWDIAKAADPDFTVANMGWWYNMNTKADYTLTPRPQYLADGRKLPDCYTQPADLRDKLQGQLGTFPLFNYWGPKTSIKSSKWIADASKITDDLYNPTLTLIYLPHLDYNLQRLGPDQNAPRLAKDLREIDAVCADLIKFYEARGAQVILLSEYGISSVNNPVHINRVLRRNGYIAVRNERDTELLDTAMSEAFAVSDHQIAHVYIQDQSKIAEVKKLLQQVEGIQEVLEGDERNIYNLAHERCGELVCIADNNSWFTYYFWLNDKMAPDYARMVDIHKKPGYDPVEMFTDPDIKMLIPLVAGKVLKKKLGFRMVMDIIPLDATLIKGSHGHVPEDKAEWPILFTKNLNQTLPQAPQATDVFSIILSHLQLPVPKQELIA